MKQAVSKQAVPKPEKPATAPEATACEKGTELGLIKIHGNVVSSIVRRAALSIPGVSRLSGSSFVDNIAEIVGSRKIHDRAIAIEIDEDKVAVEVKLNIIFGYSVPEVAGQVQSAIIEEVEKVTGMTVTRVNVIIQEIEDAPVTESPETEE
ncbi:MAG: Asp23/Gls24 family envelope stress response protein [Victivallaceae bacterium]|nr:Asp23/Gls24 family envelope stress response protein [Victivallaceae bacterium]